MVFKRLKSLYLELEEYDEALKYLQTALGYLSNHTDILYNLACVNMNPGNLEQARKHIIKYNKVKPNDLKVEELMQEIERGTTNERMQSEMEDIMNSWIGTH